MATMQPLPSVDQLCEQLPANTSRYDDPKPATSSAVVIPDGLMNQRSFKASIIVKVPDGWQRFCHPCEGRPYYRNAKLGILTESNITKGHILNRVTRWNQVISALVESSTTSDYDIVLKVSENEGEDLGSCSYYLVNYTSQVVFWLREVSTTTLGLPDVRGETHLGLLLSEQFWVHCEYMPPPHRDFTQSANELLATLGTLAIDASSSTGSVSPFHQDECESYSRALTKVLSTGQPLEVNWCIARIRSLLTQSRIINLFGEQNARTDRNVVVNGQKAPTETGNFVLWSTIMFNIPRIYLARWNAIWVDRVTYTREWKKLVKEMSEEFVYGLISSGLIIIAGISLLGLSSSTFARALAAIAMMSSICGGLYSISLLSTLRSQGGSAADAANFIQMNEHITTGLQDMALKHSIPWALIVWSGVCLFISVFWEISRDMVRVMLPLISLIRVSGKDMMVPVLVVMTYLYGRGYFSFTRLYTICRR